MKTTYKHLILIRWSCAVVGFPLEAVVHYKKSAYSAAGMNLGLNRTYL